jgi:hypothetical protein
MAFEGLLLVIDAPISISGYWLISTKIEISELVILLLILPILETVIKY